MAVIGTAGILLLVYADKQRGWRRAAMGAGGVILAGTVALTMVANLFGPIILAIWASF